jgi:hypothetical protein
MLHLLFLALVLPLSVFPSLLLQDQHPGETYVFESNAVDVPATVGRSQVILIGTRWATQFYSEAFLKAESCELKLSPIRFWLLTLTRSENPTRLFAILLPNGKIVEPKIVRR